MTPITDYRFIMFSLVFWQTDGNVNIVQTGTKAGEGSFECGTSLVLTCKIDVYSLSMSWQNDSSPTPLAECIGSFCSVDPTVAGLFEISANTSIGIFNLTIIQVTYENNGTSYMCGHDLTNVPFLVIVKDYEPTLNESTPGIIEVSSGCIDWSTEVEFLWIKVKADVAETESDYDPPNITKSSITCMGDTNCEPSHFVKETRSIRTVSGGNADYYLKAVLCYDRFCVNSSLTNQAYTIEDEGTTILPSTKPHSSIYNTNTTISTAELDTNMTPIAYTDTSISQTSTSVVTNTTISTAELDIQTTLQTYTDVSISQTNTSIVNSGKQKSEIQIVVLIAAGISVLVIFLLTTLIYFFVMRRNRPESKYWMNTDEQVISSESL